MLQRLVLCQCVAVSQRLRRDRVLQSVAACCSALQNNIVLQCHSNSIAILCYVVLLCCSATAPLPSSCVAACCSVLHCVSDLRWLRRHPVLQCVVVCRNVVRHCNVLQCVAVYCSVLQRVAVSCSVILRSCLTAALSSSGSVIILRCSVLQYTATQVCCIILVYYGVSVLQYISVIYSVLQYITVCCSILVYYGVTAAPSSVEVC